MIQPFNEYAPLHENIQWAKSFLVGKGISLEDEPYQVIRGMLEKTPGWVGLFVRFHYMERVPLDDLAVLYDTLTSLGVALKTLPQPVDKYAAYEKLCDDIENVQTRIKVNKIYQELTSPQKAQFKQMDSQTQGRFRNIAVEFMKLDRNVQQGWFRKLSGFHNIAEVVKELEIFVAACNTGWQFDMVKAEVLATEGATVVHEDAEMQMLVVQLTKYSASKALNAGTQWCIRNSKHHWKNYVNLFAQTRQFTVYNFERLFSDNDCMIGVTVDPSGHPTAIHLKDDEAMPVEKFERYATSRFIQDVFALKTPLVEQVDEMVAAFIEEFKDPYNSNDGYDDSAVRSFLGMAHAAVVARDTPERSAFKTRVLVGVLHEYRATPSSHISFMRTIVDYFKKKAAPASEKLKPLRQQLFDQMAPLLEKHLVVDARVTKGGAVLVDMYVFALGENNLQNLDRVIKITPKDPNTLSALFKAFINHQHQIDFTESVEYLVKSGVPDNRCELACYYFSKNRIPQGLEAMKANDNEKGDINGWRNVTSYFFENTDYRAMEAVLKSSPIRHVYQEIMHTRVTHIGGGGIKFNEEDQDKLHKFLRVLINYGAIPDRQIDSAIAKVAKFNDTETLTSFSSQVNYEDLTYREKSLYVGMPNPEYAKPAITTLYLTIPEVVEKHLDSCVEKNEILTVETLLMLCAAGGQSLAAKYLSYLRSGQQSTKFKKLVSQMVCYGKADVSVEMDNAMTAEELWNDEKTAKNITLETLKGIRRRGKSPELIDYCYKFYTVNVAVLIRIMVETPDWELCGFIVRQLEEEPGTSRAASFMKQVIMHQPNAVEMLTKFVGVSLQKALRHDQFIALDHHDKLAPQDAYAISMGCRLDWYKGDTLQRGHAIADTLTKIFTGGDPLEYLKAIPNLSEMNLTRVVYPVLRTKNRVAIRYVLRVWVEQLEKRNHDPSFVSTFMTTVMEEDAGFFQELYFEFPYMQRYKGQYAAAATRLLEPAIGHMLEEDGARIDKWFLEEWEQLTAEQVRDAFVQYPVDFDDDMYGTIAMDYFKHPELANEFIDNLVRRVPGFNVTDMFAAILQYKKRATASEQTLPLFLDKHGARLDKNRVQTMFQQNLIGRETASELAKLGMVREGLITRFKRF